jgi:competence ComEA-like helix-hairpin-helix protein
MNQPDHLSVEEETSVLTPSESTPDPTKQLDGGVSSDSSWKSGAPRLRGSCLHPSLVRRVVDVLGDPLWLPVVSKLAVGGLALLLVAYLGHRASADEAYGEVRTEEVSPGVPPLEEEANRHDPGFGEPPLEPTLAQVTENPAVPPPPCEKQEQTSPSGVTADGRVILNEANAEEMTRLPSVGPARAAAIVKLREQLGRFKKVSDLLRVRGIGWKTLKKMEEKVILDRPLTTDQHTPSGEHSSLVGDGGIASSKTDGDGSSTL